LEVGLYSEEDISGRAVFRELTMLAPWFQARWWLHDSDVKRTSARYDGRASSALTKSRTASYTSAVSVWNMPQHIHGTLATSLLHRA